MAWPVSGPWAGEPQRCTCTVRAVDDLADTLRCPRAWGWVAATGKWVHAWT
jgi:hypothetical protein